jgi:hypothetical protein
MHKKPRRLKNVSVSEVSIVDRPANMRKFLLFKRMGEDAGILPSSDEHGIYQAQFEAQSPEVQIEFLEQARELNDRVDAIAECRLLAQGLHNLAKRDPGLLKELEADPRAFSYIIGEDGVPIISKKISQDNPFETPSHVFEPETGRWVPKARR